MAKVLVPLAEGCEELEAVTVIDILRRAGVEVVAAGLVPGPVRASRGVVLMPDCDLDEAMRQDYDMVVLPGGAGGAERLEADERIRALLQRMAADGRYTAAICAAPRVLARAGLLDSRQATAYPGHIEALQVPGLRYREAAVVCDGTVITSRGPGTALDFALTVVERLCGEAVRTRVEAALQRP